MQRQTIHTLVSLTVAIGLCGCVHEGQGSSAAARSQGAGGETTGESRADEGARAKASASAASGTADAGAASAKGDDWLSSEVQTMEKQGARGDGGAADESRRARQRRAKKRLQRALQAARRAETAHGGPPCEGAYVSRKAMTEKLAEQSQLTPEQAQQRMPAREQFVSACKMLPAEAQQCMLIGYALQHRRKCAQVKRDLDPELLRKVQKSMQPPGAAPGGAARPRAPGTPRGGSAGGAGTPPTGGSGAGEGPGLEVPAGGADAGAGPAAPHQPKEPIQLGPPDDR